MRKNPVVVWCAVVVIAGLHAGAATAQTRAPRCQAESGRRAEQLSGEVARGATYARDAAGGWILKLSPTEHGWLVQVNAKDRGDEDLARLTPPFHFVPNPRSLDGWHFRNEDNTGPNDGSVNAPQELREFIFSPRVGRDIQGDAATTGPTGAEVAAVQAFGRGWLYIDSYRLSPPRAGGRATFESLRFSACLTWPAA
jgi:hypothetical protein